MTRILEHSKPRFLSFALPVALLSSALPAAQPLTLHPENPHYFLFRGKPTVIITSGEHYGAVLNLDFDYVRYLKALNREGLNGTRTWAGAYCEPSSAFNIASNTLAPLPGRFISPWARSQEPGYANGGNKFDLNRWDAAYFKRLRDFMRHADRSGVIVELNLFCPFYDESMWRLSPMNAANNVNGVGTVSRTNVYTLDKHGGLLEVQEAMVKKIVTELKDFDNLYYEICNEPYFGGITLEWQRRIADVITETEYGLGVRHLISQNIANEKAVVANPHPQVSIFNFHYATPPDTVAMNYGLNRVLGDNETGFRGTNGAPYRFEAWEFMVAGGGLFNNLDYSFVAGREDGTFVYPAKQPGSGNPALRAQFGFLSRLFNQLDFVHMQPDNGSIQAALPPGVTMRVLAKPRQDYLVYVRVSPGEPQNDPGSSRIIGRGEVAVGLSVEQGEFVVEWFNPETGALLERSRVAFDGGTVKISSPAFEEDAVLLVRKK